MLGNPHIRMSSLCPRILHAALLSIVSKRVLELLHLLNILLLRSLWRRTRVNLLLPCIPLGLLLCKRLAMRPPPVSKKRYIPSFGKSLAALPLRSLSHFSRPCREHRATSGQYSEVYSRLLWGYATSRSSLSFGFALSLRLSSTAVLNSADCVAGAIVRICLVRECRWEVCVGC